MTLLYILCVLYCMHYVVAQRTDSLMIGNVLSRLFAGRFFYCGLKKCGFGTQFCDTQQDQCRDCALLCKAEKFDGEGCRNHCSEWRNEWIHTKDVLQAREEVESNKVTTTPYTGLATTIGEPPVEPVMLSHDDGYSLKEVIGIGVVVTIIVLLVNVLGWLICFKTAKGRKQVIAWLNRAERPHHQSAQNELHVTQNGGQNALTQVSTDTGNCNAISSETTPFLPATSGGPDTGSTGLNDEQVDYLHKDLEYAGGASTRTSLVPPGPHPTESQFSRIRPEYARSEPAATVARSSHDQQNHRRGASDSSKDVLLEPLLVVPKACKDDSTHHQNTRDGSMTKRFIPNMSTSKSSPSVGTCEPSGPPPRKAPDIMIKPEQACPEQPESTRASPITAQPSDAESTTVIEVQVLSLG